VKQLNIIKMGKVVMKAKSLYPEKTSRLARLTLTAIKERRNQATRQKRKIMARVMLH